MSRNIEWLSVLFLAFAIPLVVVASVSVLLPNLMFVYQSDSAFKEESLIWVNLMHFLIGTETGLFVHYILALWFFINAYFNWIMCIAVPSFYIAPEKTEDQVASSSTASTSTSTYCQFCKASRPLRAHHCATCNQCVVRRDHHCHFTTNCVGQYNHRYFLLFLFYACFSGIYGAFLAFQLPLPSGAYNLALFVFPWLSFVSHSFGVGFSNYLNLQHREIYISTLSIAAVVALRTFFVIVALGTGGLLILQLRAISFGQTLLERKRHTPSAFEQLGFFENIKSVIGYQKYWWLTWCIPTFTFPNHRKILLTALRRWFSTGFGFLKRSSSTVDNTHFVHEERKTF